LMLTLVAQAAAPNFAGTWTLDKSKSQGLSQRMQGADSVQWVITQTDKELTIEEKVTGGQMGGGGGASAGAAPAGAPPAGAPPAGGGGGQGGGRGGMGMGGPRTYNLDGSEVATDTGRGKLVRKAAWAADKTTLELSSTATFSGPNGEMTTTSTDKLTLSGDGKTLTVVSHRETPRGPQDTTYVFNK
jgi:hypothetical protein